MGLDHTTLETFIYSLKYAPDFLNILTLGRQYIYTIDERIKSIPIKYNYKVSDSTFQKDSEPLLREIGFQEIDSMDYSSYENATIIHNLNMPIVSEKTYSVILDGGCTEHIYNIPQVFSNIIKMLKVGGIYVGITVNNNFSGHGFYQFSPEFFLSTFSQKYGMELLELCLIKNGDDFNSRVNVKSYETGRNTTSLHTLEQTYILIIAKKIKESPFDLNSTHPLQHSYETIDWK